MATFYTEVIQRDPRFNLAARVNDIQLLEPKTRELVQLILAGAARIGINVAAYETYRSEARQAALYANGATQLQVVGVHHYGLACDIVRIVTGEPSWKGDFSFLGELAHSAGMIWGGDWGKPNVPHSFRDLVHVQRCTVARQPNLFNGSWYPCDTYNPYEDEPHILFASTFATRV
jgi:D-alanyl-D-alanine carboxypeptidase